MTRTRCCEKSFDADLGSFTQSYGSKLVDASLLLTRSAQRQPRCPSYFTKHTFPGASVPEVLGVTATERSASVK